MPSPPQLPRRTGSRRHQASILLITALLVTMPPAAADHLRPMTPAWLAARAGVAHGGATPNQSGNSAAVAQSLADMRKAARALSTTTTSAASALKVPSLQNGLASGWLAPDPGQAWSGATLNTPTQANGKTIVTITQSQKTAVVYWQSFNVGAQTNLEFNQSAGGSAASSWVALNVLAATNVAPSYILGSITAPGQVYIINRNGIIFGPSSQVNTASLLASTADFTNYVQGFLGNGIYSQTGSTGLLPAFTADPTGSKAGVVVEPGAAINALAPTSAASRGGFVLLMGGYVQNNGTVTAPSGQVALAAGNSFLVTPGYTPSASSTGDPLATTLGMEIAVNSTGSGYVVTPDGNSVALGSAVNGTSGILASTIGDVTMVGETVQQDGIAYATTTTSQRGTIHLLTSLSDSNGTVTLGPSSVTWIAPDLADTTQALNSQRAALIAASAADNALRLTTTPALNNVAGLADQLEQSRVEITAGGLVNAQSGSLTMAQGGQIAIATGITGAGRIYVASGATLDASGVLNVSLPMSANYVTVNVQSNELRDSSANRLSQALAGDNVTVDLRTLTLVPATTAYPSDRYYTAGGLLEVSGYLNDVGHTIGEWSAVGGTITLSAPQVVAQSGSVFNLAGGSIAYQAGSIPQTWLVGTDGQLYNLVTASGLLTYTGVFDGFVTTNSRWNITDNYGAGLSAVTQVHYPAYTVGRDAGSLVLSTSSVVFAGTIDSGVVTSPNQTAARPSGISDPYLLPQTTVPLAGSLLLGDYGPTGLVGASVTAVVLGQAPPMNATALAATDPIPADALNTAYIDASVLNSAPLGGLSIATSQPVSIAAALSFAPGASVSIVAPSVTIAADLSLPAGTLTLTNKLNTGATPTYLTADGGVGVTVQSGVIINASGLWTNASIDPTTAPGAVYAGGGSVTIDSSQGVSLLGGSVIDVSAGGGFSATGAFFGGKAGSVSLIADDPAAGGTATAPLLLDGTLDGFGVTGAGTLQITAPSVLIAGASAAPPDGSLLLTPALFRRGFANYNVDGLLGLSVAPGTILDVVAPTLQRTASAANQPSGADSGAALATLLAPLFTVDTQRSTMMQRGGASLSLSATTSSAGGALTIGQGARLRVDPGQSVTLTAYDSITVLGSIIAHGGAVTLTNTRYQDGTNSALLVQYSPGLAIWIGANSRIDVSGIAYTATNFMNDPFGIVQSGGSITMGGIGGTAGDGTTRSTAAQIVIQPGAVLDASGARATIDPTAGTSTLLSQSAGASVLDGGNGGSLSLSSYSGIFNGGAMRAAAGTATAAGGSLSVSLEAPVFDNSFATPADSVVSPPEIIVSAMPTQILPATLAPGDATPASDYAQAYISAQQVNQGGFGTVTLTARGLILFDGNVRLHAGQSITLSQGILAQTGSKASVELDAPYVKLGGLSSISLLSTSVSGQITNNWSPPASRGSGTFTVNADQIDVQNDIRFGTSATLSLPDGTPSALAFNGFADVRLNSQGDIRFLSAQSAPSSTTSILTNANVTLVAAQIYPVSGAVATVTAGENFQATGTNALPKSGRLMIPGNGTDPAPPMSVGGSLTLVAGTVIQGGIVRAPEGTITLGETGSTFTSRVELLPGSVTSVSAYGETIPYGGTSDTISYTYNAQAIDVFAPTINLDGASFDVQAGAVLDLRGGGTLTGGGGELLKTSQTGVSVVSQGFISGRGGSTDILVTPLLSFSAAKRTVSAPSLGTDPVFAIVPSVQLSYAPVTPLDTNASYYGSVPKVGEQITIGAGVPGLPAGTYTLLPSYYALLPGGYRVELATTGTLVSQSPQAVGNGTYVLPGYTGVANTAIRSATAIPVYVTSGSNVRQASQYSEESYTAYLTTQAATFDTQRPLLPQDAGQLALSFVAGRANATPLTFDGSALLQPASGGFGGTVSVSGAQTAALEITGPEGATGKHTIAVSAAALDDLGAARLVIGGSVSYNVGVGGSGQQSSITLSASVASVTVDSGATLRAPDVFLLASSSVGSGAIMVQSGATIDTIGAGAPPYDSASTGLAYDTQRNTALLVSNGSITLAPVNLILGLSSGPLTIADGASVYAGGSIIVSSEQLVSIGTGAQLGASLINLAVPVVNIGVPSDPSVPVPTGLVLTQGVLDALLDGNAAAGVPDLSSLEITASSALEIYGSVDLNAIGAGSGGLSQLILNTPAIYGQGAAGDNATITTRSLVWNGVATQSLSTPGSMTPGGILMGGAGTGQGTLTLQAGTMTLGYPNGVEPSAQVTLNRVMFGFSTVNLVGTSEIVFNNQGSLSVYQQQQGVGFTGTGGNLNLVTPLVTAASNSQFAITAGGQVSLNAAAGSAGSAAVTAQGSSLSITGAAITDAGTIRLPVGTISLLATLGDITLQSGAALVVAGPNTALFDQTVSSPGGAVSLESTSGNITTATGSLIDVSSAGAAAGSLSVTATSGTVALDGTISGSASSGQSQGSLSVRALAVPDVSALISSARQGHFTRSLSLDVGSGDLTLGDVQAQQISISASGGSLTVAGTLDASGSAPGSITLSALDGLTIDGSAILDAHASVARTDSSGAPIASENRADVSLTARTGMLTLDAGSLIDVSNATGTAYGTVELYAPRVDGNSVKVAAEGGITVAGAQGIALYGMRTYVPASGVVTQSSLKAINADNAAFVDAAIANQALLSNISGLLAYGDVFHLRPGVEIDSRTPNGSITVSGDLDLHTMRYTALDGTGSVEPGVLVLRAGGNLNIFGSISDGFGVPVDNAKNPNPDDNGWVLLKGTVPEGQSIVVPSSVTLSAGTTYDTTAGGSLNYAITINHAVLNANVVIPTWVTLAGNYKIPAGGLVATANVYDATGTLAFAKGSLIPQGTVIGTGWSLAAGAVMPFPLHLEAGTVWPAGASLALFNSAKIALDAAAILPAGGVIPADTTVVLPHGAQEVALRRSILFLDGQPSRSGGKGSVTIQGRIRATAPLLTDDSSWSVQLVGGANLASSNTKAVQAASVLAASGAAGNIVLSDPHYVDPAAGSDASTIAGQVEPGLSVIRTGTGDLSLTAGGSINEDSLYGIYTAGTQVGAVAAAYDAPRGTLLGDSSVLSVTGSYDYNRLLKGYSAWYPSGGGNLSVSAQGNLTGDVFSQTSGGTENYQSDAVGNWLWRQGGFTGQATAWWINFGSYATSASGQLTLVGFTGFGTLGGGNISITVGGNAGNLVTDAASPYVSTAIDAVVASTGQVSGQTITETGGGSLTIMIGGTLNPANIAGANGLAGRLTGVIGSMRGNVEVAAGAIGSVVPSSVTQSVGPLIQTVSDAAGGPLLLLGDARARLTTQGNLVLGGVIDPGRVNTANTTPYTTDLTGAQSGGGQAAFTLWEGNTAIDLFAAGGTLVPSLSVSGPNIGQDMQITYPPTLIAVAATGNIVYGTTQGDSETLGPSIELMPSATGQLQLLAGGSIDAAGLSTLLPLGIDVSGASTGQLPTPLNPAYQGQYLDQDGNGQIVSNATDAYNTAGYTSLFAFGADTAAGSTALHANDMNPILIYAAGGDIVDLNFGETLEFLSGTTVLAKWYIAAKPADIRAERDILGGGTASLASTPSALNTGGIETIRNLVLNINPGDVSSITAGRDIFYANDSIAGPGTLIVTAGRNVYQADKGTLYSAGEIINVSAANETSGAGIIMLAGAGSTGPDWQNFLNLYFNPANEADPSLPLSDPGNLGKVSGDFAGSVMLLSWMQTHFGYAGDQAGALAAFKALPLTEQEPFLLEAYFAVLNASAIAYNTPASLSYKGYLIGEEAVAALFGLDSVSPTTTALADAVPATQSAWAANLPYLQRIAGSVPSGLSGNLTLYGGSGITTQLGGGITVLAPYGQIALGLASVPPPTPAAGQPAAGLIAADTGDVDVYVHGTINFGQSRAFAIGGNATVWSQTGDIDLGLGSKTTQVYQPPSVTYDNYGDITLSPVVPTQGAGIATLSPEPGLPAGDLYLVTPFGVINLGEAGARSSGNVVLAGTVIGTGGIVAAKSVVGEASVSSSNAGALAAGASVAGAAAAAANNNTDDERRRRANQVPSVITVEVISFGGAG